MGLAVTANFKDHQWGLSSSTSALATNCGAGLITSVHVHKKALPKPSPTGWGTYQPYVNFSLEEAFEFLDAHKDAIVGSLTEYGFYVLSDAVGDISDFDRTNKYYTESNSFINTSRFMAWVISRKIGAVFRGPICTNQNYVAAGVGPANSGHNIVGWFWVPFTKYLRDAECKVYSDVKIKDGPVTKRAKAYSKKEAKLASGEIKAAPAKAAPKPRKPRANTNRVRHQAQQQPAYAALNTNVEAQRQAALANG